MAETGDQPSQSLPGQVPARGPVPGIGAGVLFILTLTAGGFAFSGLVPFSSLAGLSIRGGLFGTLALALAACLILGYNYTVMGAVVRRDGADYLLSSRLLKPSFAFAASLTMVVSSALMVGFILARSGQVMLTVWMRALAAAYSSTSLLQTATYLSTPQGISVIGAVAVALAFLLSIFPPLANRRMIQTGFVLMVISWVTAAVMLAAPAWPFELSWDTVFGQGAYGNAVAAAGELSAQGETGLPIVLAGALAVSWIGFGLRTPAFLAGAVEKPSRSFLTGGLGGALMSIMVVLAFTLLLQQRAPADWLSAQSALYLYGADAWPWLPLYAYISRPDPFLLSFICLVWLFSLINLAQVVFITLSRVIDAWLADGLFPPVLGYLHPLLKTPIVSLMLLAILAEIGVLVVALNGKNVLAGYSFLFIPIIAQVPTFLAVTLIPFHRKEWLDSSHQLGIRFTHFHIGRLPLVSLTGLFSLAVSLAALAAGLAVRQLASQIQTALILAAVIAVLGVGWYAVNSRLHPGMHKRFGQLPTEGK